MKDCQSDCLGKKEQMSQIISSTYCSPSSSKSASPLDSSLLFVDFSLSPAGSSLSEEKPSFSISVTAPNFTFDFLGVFSLSLSIETYLSTSTSVTFSSVIVPTNMPR